MPCPYGVVKRIENRCIHLCTRKKASANICVHLCSSVFICG
ncbi:hypothetical protein [Microseira wollei]|nr:hypothetical protein [Microseira wollei]